jgi:hypothetical protein
MTSLFIKPDVKFEKIAAETDLPEDPNTWSNEVLQELYKQAPFISDFEPHVVMQKVDGERGYGLGQVELTHNTEAQPGTNPEALQAAGIRTVRIPVIIKERKLQPFDLLLNDTGSVLPLTENRLRQAMFRPQMFDVTSQTPGDSSLVGQLYPPYRMNMGFGGGGMAFSGGVAKTSSAHLEDAFHGTAESTEKAASEKKASVEFKETGSILGEVLSTLRKEDVDSMFDKVASDEGLQAAIRMNMKAFGPSLQKLAAYESMPQDKIAAAAYRAITPDTVQFTRSPNGYMMKRAAAKAWHPTTVEIDRGQLVQMVGTKVALALDATGSVTIGHEGENADAAPTTRDNAEIVSKSGLYKVWEESQNKELIGAVIPNLIDFNGKPVPLTLFTNGSEAALQTAIMGAPAGGAATLPSAPVRGAGIFFTTGVDGELKATMPCIIQHSVEMPGEPVGHVATTLNGDYVEFSQQGVKDIVVTPEGKTLIPMHWSWSPLGDADLVALVGGESGKQNVETDAVMGEKSASPAITIRAYDRDCISLNGPAVEKLAYAEREGVDLDAALFILTTAGVDPTFGAKKIASSIAGSMPVTVQARQVLVPLEERAKVASASLEQLKQFTDALRVDLVKEAAFVPDPTAVDTILSLGFINPENAMMFASFLPTIERAQLKLAELLLGVRMGLPGIPVFALERAVRAVEEAIVGLKTLAFQGV